MRPAARTVQQYLKDASPNNRVMLTAVREVVRTNLPDGFVESMTRGMPTYEVPLERSPQVYDPEPLAYVVLEEEKRNCSLHLLRLRDDAGLEQDFRARWRPPSRRALDMSRACIRFRALKDLDLDLVGEVVRGTTVDGFVAAFVDAQSGSRGD